ncbi:UNVERIFIED_CONTAM: hypothetical protein FKN15_040344 [Acipenser sinensis]
MLRHPRCMDAACISALGALVLRHPRCSIASTPPCFGTFGAQLPASIPSVLQSLDASVHWCFDNLIAPEPRRLGALVLRQPHCSRASTPRCIGASTTSLLQSLDASVHWCFDNLIAPEPRRLGALVLRQPHCSRASTPRCIGASTTSLLQSLDASVLRHLRCTGAPCIDTLCAPEPRRLGALVLRQPHCSRASTPRCFSAQALPASISLVYRCLSASAPSVPQNLETSVLWRIWCSDTPSIDTFGDLDASTFQSLSTSVLRSFSVPELRCLGAPGPRCIGDPLVQMLRASHC